MLIQAATFLWQISLLHLHLSFSLKFSLGHSFSVHSALQAVPAEKKLPVLTLLPHSPKGDMSIVEFILQFGQERPLTLPLLPFVTPFSSPPHPPTITAPQVPVWV